MPEGSVETRCPACSEPVFDGCNVVRCNRCEALHHEACWERRRSCAARKSCRGRPQPVLVVRVPQAVDAAELVARAAETATMRLEETALPRVETRASGDDLEAASSALTERIEQAEKTVCGAVRAEAAALRREIERLRSRVEEASASIRKLAAPETSLARSIADAVGQELDRRLEDIARSTQGATEGTHAALEAATAALRSRLEETHFALERSRRPFPWEDAAPAGAAEGRTE